MISFSQFYYYSLVYKRQIGKALVDFSQSTMHIKLVVPNFLGKDFFFFLLPFQKNQLLKCAFLSFFIFLNFYSLGQRIYPIYYFRCSSSNSDPDDIEACSAFELEDVQAKWADGDFSTFETWNFYSNRLSPNRTAYIAVMFSVDSPISLERNIGIKFGFDSGIFSSVEFLSTFEFYLLDVDGFRMGDLIRFNLDDLQINYGDSSFEIVLDNLPQEFYGVELFINNTSGIWNNKPFKVYEFYVLDSSCEDYVDYIFSNSLGNEGEILEVGDNLELNPGTGSLDVSFLFDSYSVEGDSVLLVFEEINGFSFSTLNIVPYSDNTLSSSLILSEQNAVIKEVGPHLVQVTFAVDVSFNRLKLSLEEKFVIKSLIRKSGGFSLDISPKFAKEENGKYIYWEGVSPIFLEPSLANSPSSDFKWFFDFELKEEIKHGDIINGVSYSILSDDDVLSNCTLKIENLPYRDPIDPYVFFVAGYDPISQCRIVKRINFEVEGIILPFLEFSLQGKILPDNKILIEGGILTGKPELYSNIRIEKAGDDLQFLGNFPFFETDIPDKFSFKDESPFFGNNFYRISVFSSILNKNIYSNVINVLYTKVWDEIPVAVFPNPFTDYINLRFKQFSNELITINIYDIAGQLLFTTTLNSNDEKSHVSRLDLDFLKNGIYILNIESSVFSKSFKIFRK